jgi:hypothetical protein
LPKTWSVVAVTRSPTKFKIRMKDTDDPANQQNDLPSEYETVQLARQAVEQWKSARVQQETETS